MEVPTASIPKFETSLQCSIDHIVFLDRLSEKSFGLERYSKETAREWFSQTLYSMPEVRKVQTESVIRLLAADTWELRYDHLDDAIDQLELLAYRSK